MQRHYVGARALPGICWPPATTIATTAAPPPHCTLGALPRPQTPDEDQPKEEWDRDGADKLAKAGRLCKLYGRLEQAERLTRRALEVKQYVMGDDHPDTLTALDNLALILKEQGRLADSEPLFRKVRGSWGGGWSAKGVE